MDQSELRDSCLESRLGRTCVSVCIKWVILDIVYCIEVFNDDISEKRSVGVRKERCDLILA